MGEFTAAELANIGNSVLDFHMKGRADPQSIQNKPLWKALKSKQKTFPGGKELITFPVVFDYTTTLQGFSHDDEVSYANPANTKRGSTNWKELHAGIQFTATELKHAGISIVDTLDGAKTRNHAEKDKIELTNLFQEKLYDMDEGVDRGMNNMLWRDGTQDASLVAGIQSIITASPSTGITYGLDRAANALWRNRSIQNLSTATPSNMAICDALQTEYRQLRRYSAGPTHMFAGSGFIGAMEDELRAKGEITNTGWAVSKDGKNARLEASMSDISFRGMLVEYDPTMDDEGLTNDMFWLDLNAICLMVMDGEDMKQHTPARPHNKYVFYRAVTWTGGMIAKRLNSSGRYKLA
jgi:hypothetical protein